jgi:hypothetical protein
LLGLVGFLDPVSNGVRGDLICGAKCPPIVDYNPTWGQPSVVSMNNKNTGGAIPIASLAGSKG